MLLEELNTIKNISDKDLSDALFQMSQFGSNNSEEGQFYCG